jgi:heavy metal translocating P-type ATPase
MTDTITFDVDGMHCASCVTRVERILSRQDGVEDTVVNLTSHTATITAAPDVVVESLKAAVAKAGYDLEVQTLPVDIVAHHDDDRRAQWRRFIWAAAFAVPTIALATTGIEAEWPRIAQGLLAAPAVFWAGAEFHRVAFRLLRARSANMDTLISLGTLSAFGYSVWGLIAGEPVFFETAAAIVAFLLLGRYFEARAKGRASEAIAALLDINAPEARVDRNGTWVTVPLEEVLPGALIEVRPGDRVPVDGEIVEGATTIDESMITGETIPAARTVEDRVIGGTINGSGRFVMRANAVGDDTVLAGIVRMVESAQASKAPIQGLADRVASIFVPVVLLIALATLVGWSLSGAEIGDAVRNAVAVLIIACPCALGLATPTAILVGSGRGAELGVIFRSADTFERIVAVDVVAFDKTGTLTTGQMMLEEAISEDGNFLERVAAVESATGHPIGEAVARAAIEQGLTLPNATDVTVIPGRGAVGLVDGIEVTVGTAALMAERNIDLPLQWEAAIGAAQHRGTTAFAGAWDGVVQGVLSVADTIRPESVEAISELTNQGIETMLLTGDHERTARAIARQVGITDVASRLLPEHKAHAVKARQAKGETVAFVGDGINDAPALVTADLGMSIGTGSDIAIETASVTLMSGNPRLVSTAIGLAARTLRSIKQNLGWAFGYNIAAIPLAATGLLNPMIASAAMAFSSVSVVLNSLRIRRWKP